MAPTDGRPGRRDGWLASVVILLWPFLYFWPLLVGRRLSIGNDFVSLYYRYKHVLLDVLALDGRLPLWSPSEAAGYPFFSNPFTATFYPPNALLVLWYQLAGGYSRYRHVIFTIAGISIFAIGLYLWLREVGHTVRTAAVTAIIFGTSLKVVELIRFPNAVHTAAWIPWLLLGTTLALIGKRVRLGALIAGVALVLAGTAGYPYILYYQIFLLVPYALLLIAPSTRAVLVEGATSDRIGWPRLAWLGGAVAGAVIVISPYLLQVRNLLAQTTDRTGGSFAYSTADSWRLTDTIGSLVYPMIASAEGWYYFGIAPLLFMLVFVSVTLLRNRKSEPHNVRFILVIGIWWLLVTYITFGRSSYLFELLWHTLPVFSSLRTWPRLNIVLVPLLALLFARAWQWFETSSEQMERQTKARILGVLCVVVVGTQLTLQLGTIPHRLYHSYFEFVPSYFNDVVRPELAGRLPEIVLDLGTLALSPAWYLVMGVISSIFVVTTVFARRRRPWIVACALICLTTIDVWPLGFRQWVTPARPGDFTARELDVSSASMAALLTPRVWDYATVQLTPPYNVGTIANWYYERYVRFLTSEGIVTDITPFKRTLAARQSLTRLMGLDTGERFFLSTRIDHDSADAYMADVDETAERCRTSVEPVAYNGDQLTVDVESSCGIYLSFIDNWDPAWKASVDGQEREIERLFGTFKSVKLDPGESRVRMWFAPSLF